MQKKSGILKIPLPSTITCTICAQVTVINKKTGGRTTGRQFLLFLMDKIIIHNSFFLS
ncbi:hypothetical protein CLOSYM_01248 [[Clostridium] symbiosum ATCC 14940]|uniref:Transposase n=1 Tax=[Clostridium] symbiosum ATCC 14940 TaxID=411472 RepID=A0ABC9U0W9_CLOSY|nr:hypothetical protein CLOSYM_01248 [[Clostridium] symbiosum ATCC 14940]